jgi:hypothetical protein
MTALDPAFARRVEGLLADLRDAGWDPVVRGTWRDPRRQAAYRALGFSQRVKSLHERTDARGRAAALAVDVIDATTQLDVWTHARFYADLRSFAPRHALVTGGTWTRSDLLWRQFDLGWDPGHVQLATAPRRK